MIYREALASLLFKKKTQFILVGNENYLKEHFIKMAEKTYPEYSIKVMSPEEQVEALTLLRCDSLFDDNLIVLKNFDKMKIEAFENIISSYDGNLILSLSEKARPKSRAMTKILSNLVVAECKKLREYGTDYPLWIRSLISESDYEAPDMVDQLIYSKVGPNMYVIAHELEKLFILKSKDKVITIKDVNNFIPVSATSTAFELFESLLRRNITKALIRFSSYAKNHDNFFEIIAFMGSYLEKMYRILLFRERQFDVGDIADIVGIPKFLVRTRYLPWALAFGKKELASKINSICDLNIQLRLFKGKKTILFERFILSFKK